MSDDLEGFYNEVMKFLQQKHPQCWLRQACLGKDWITLTIKFPRKKVGEQK